MHATQMFRIVAARVESIERDALIGDVVHDMLVARRGLGNACMAPAVTPLPGQDRSRILKSPPARCGDVELGMKRPDKMLSMLKNMIVIRPLQPGLKLQKNGQRPRSRRFCSRRKSLPAPHGCRADGLRRRETGKLVS
jgi:hypothetical protein